MTTLLFFLDIRFWLFFGVLSWAVMFACDTITGRRFIFGKPFVKGRGLPGFLICIFLMPAAFVLAVFALCRWLTAKPLPESDA